MPKKFLPAFVVTFVLYFLMEWILHGQLLMGIYAGASQLMLPQSMMMSRMVWMLLGYLILAFCWVYFFGKFSTKKDIAKGIVWGLSLMMFLKVPEALISYSVMTLSGWAYLWNIVGGVVEGAVIGAIMGMLMREKA